MAFDNTPKVSVDVSDGNLRVAPIPGLPKITLLGITDSAHANAKVNEPVLVSGDVRPSNFDLLSGQPSELSKAIQECRDAGADNIEVMIISSANSTTLDQRYVDLDTSYGLLLNHGVDVVVPVGAYIDVPSASGNFGYQLANFCYKSTVSFDSCLGVLGTSPVTATDAISLTELSSWVTGMKSYDTTGVAENGAAFTGYDGTTDGGADGVPDNFAFYATTDETLATGSPPSVDSDIVTDDNGNAVDIGAYISVVAGQYSFSNKLAKKVNPTTGLYSNDGAAAYAGFMSALPPQSAPTNKVVPSVGIIRNLSVTQADDLAKNRFVTFYSKPKGTVVFNAMTGAYNISTTYRSDFVRLSTMRIVHDAIERVRAVSDPFIGEPINGITRSALRAEIDQTLARLIQQGALRRYDYALRATADMQVLGQMQIEMTLVPAFELTEVIVKVGLAKE